MIYYKSMDSGTESPVTFVDLSDAFIGYEQNMTVQEVSNMFDCSSFTFTLSIPAERMIAIIFRSMRNNWRKMRHIPKRRTWNIKRYRRRI